jgi:hypothetical protein
MGFEILPVDVSEFILAGGAAKCLCLLLAQDSVVPWRTAPLLSLPFASSAWR